MGDADRGRARRIGHLVQERVTSGTGAGLEVARVVDERRCGLADDARHARRAGEGRCEQRVAIARHAAQSVVEVRGDEVPRGNARGGTDPSHGLEQRGRVRATRERDDRRRGLGDPTVTVASKAAAKAESRWEEGEEVAAGRLELPTRGL